MTTPAQASGHPNFVTDVPVQGPTDEGLRAADCWFAQNRLPARSSCADCGGSSPMQQSSGLVGERVAFGGRGALGFAVGAAGDPEIWSKLSNDQQMWVSNTLNKLNDMVVKQSGTTCPTWGPAINLAGGCFQSWYNANYAAPKGPNKALRSDGVFDEDTLCGLITVAGIHATELPTPFPDPSKQYCQVAPVATSSSGLVGTKKKLSTGAMVGIGAAGAAVLGGIYAATRPHSRRRK